MRLPWYRVETLKRPLVNAMFLQSAMNFLLRALQSRWLTPPIVTCLVVLLLLADEGEKAVVKTERNSNFSIRGSGSNDKNGAMKNSDDSEVDAPRVRMPTPVENIVESDATQNTDDVVKSLIFVTSHVNLSQIDFFKHCWPILLQQSTLLNSADVMVFAASDGNSGLEGALRYAVTSLFPEALGQSESAGDGRNVTLKFFANPGYQEGAIKAMSDAMEQQFFRQYDWIVRIKSGCSHSRR